VALRPNAGHGFVILDVYRSHTTTHHSRYDSSVRLISLSQRHLPDDTQHSLQRETDVPPVGFSRREAADPRLSPRSQWDRHSRLGSRNAIQCTPITSWPEVGLCRVLLNHLMEIIEYCFCRPLPVSSTSLDYGAESIYISYNRWRNVVKWTKTLSVPVTHRGCETLQREREREKCILYDLDTSWSRATDDKTAVFSL
jgi:hypothetical protein